MKTKHWLTVLGWVLRNFILLNLFFYLLLVFVTFDFYFFNVFSPAFFRVIELVFIILSIGATLNKRI